MSTRQPEDWTAHAESVLQMLEHPLAGDPETESAEVNLATASCPCCGAIIPLDTRDGFDGECPTCRRVNDRTEVFSR